MIKRVLFYQENTYLGMDRSRRQDESRFSGLSFTLVHSMLFLASYLSHARTLSRVFVCHPQSSLSYTFAIGIHRNTMRDGVIEQLLKATSQPLVTLSPWRYPKPIILLMNQVRTPKMEHSAPAMLPEVANRDLLKTYIDLFSKLSRPVGAFALFRVLYFKKC